jgi:hypothetical protein
MSFLQSHYILTFQLDQDVRYLAPLVREVELAEAERKEWDTVEVKVEKS